MKSKEHRAQPTFLRNEYPCSPFGFPIVEKQEVPHIDEMLSVCHMRLNDERAQRARHLVHFFKDDYVFTTLYDKPNSSHSQRILRQLAQYAAVCSPDFSVYPEMPLPVQQKQIFKNRWCGAWLQSKELIVVPTITWGEQSSFSFCFEGVPCHSTVAVSTVGSRHSKEGFLLGYEKMMEVLQPEQIICYGQPFDEMDGNIMCFPYDTFEKECG